MARKRPRSVPSDLATHPSEQPTDAESQVEELVRRGLKAVEDYDYELARTTLTRAFELSSGAEVPARALLTLLVDHLAAYQEALQWGDRLSKEAQTSSGVRLMLALAAARCGDSQRARSHVGRLESAAAAEVLIVLAETIFASGEIDEAASLCEAARLHDGAHPGIRSLARRIAQVREDERRPHETEIEHLLADGLLDEARRLAEQLLTRHPESVVARRATRAALERQRADEAERRVKEAEESLTQVDVENARAACQAARLAVAAAPAEERITHRLAVVEAELAERELTARAGTMVRRLAECDYRAGLEDYASQPPAVRARIRELMRREVFDDLEQLLDRRATSEEAIDALLAYTAAVASADFHPQEALQTLATHERALAGFGAASRLAARLRQRLREDHRRELLGRLSTARAALDGGDAAAALERLGKESFHELDLADREEVEALRARARTLIETQEMEAAYERLLKSGSPLAAREVAEQLQARAGETERERRERQVQAAKDAARREFGVWVSRDDHARAGDGEARRAIELGAPLELAASGKDPLPWLDAEARSLVLLECCHRWLFIQEIDLSIARVRARVLLRTPERLFDVTTAVSPDGKFVIASADGRILELSQETWQPLSWQTLRDFKVGNKIDEIQFAPGGRHAWVRSRPDFDLLGRQVQVVDLERRRPARSISEGYWFRPLVGLDEPLMAHSRHGGALSLHHPGGATTDGDAFQFSVLVRAVLAHPGRGRLLVFVSSKNEHRERFGFMEIDATGRASKPRWLNDVDATKPWICATALAHRTSFLVAHDDHGAAHLLAMGTTTNVPDQLDLLYRVPLPGDVSLVHDPSSRRVVALITDGELLHAVPLGSEAPRFPECRSSLDPAGTRALEGDCRGFYINAEAVSSFRDLRGMPARRVMEWTQQQIDECGADTARLTLIFDGLSMAGQTDAVDLMIRTITTKYPSDPSLAMLEVELLVDGRRWSDVRRRLEAVDLHGVMLNRRQHAFHLLGLAWLYEGEVERAVQVFEEGLKVSHGACPLAMLLAMYRARPSDGAGADYLRELRAAIEGADDCLLRNDRAGARAAIDRPMVWSSREVQSLARLAELELKVEPDDDAGKFRKALALARFVLALRMPGGFRRELPLPGAGWPRERMLDIEARAKRWLDRLGGREDPIAAGPLAADAPPAAEVPPALEIPPGADATCAVVDSSASLPPSEVDPQPAWALALQEFDGAFAALGAESPRAPARLAFRVRHEGRRLAGIEVLLQRLLRNGRFSAGQVADSRDLLAAPESLTDDADAAAVVVITEAHQPSRARSSLSRARTLRLLGTLIGHPRVFLHDRPSEPIEVRRGELAVELVDTADGLELRFLVGGARWTAGELLAHVDASVAIDVDADARVVTVARLGAEALALARVFERLRPVFPPESHDQLLQRLGAVQHVLDLRVPSALAGEIHEADSRPVVRLTPVDETELIVEIGVRPVPGSVLGPPGEGTQLALGGVGGLRVSARRDFNRERAAAMEVAEMLRSAAPEGRWRWRVTGEEQLVALVEELAKRGSEVIVEWPKNARAWRRIGEATLEALRVRVDHGRDLLRIAGEIEIDGHRVALAVLLEAIAEGRRYVVVGPQMFVAIAADLRERLEAARELIFGGRGGLEAGLAAAPVLAGLANETTAPDPAWSALRDRALEARTLDPSLPTGLNAELRDYQIEGFRWLERLSAWASGACLADDMGLGKTLQTLALLVHRASLGPALVIAPVSVTPGWNSESARFAPGLRVRPYRGGQRLALLTDLRAGDVLVAGYGVVARDADALSGVRFATLVLDEAHMIKNASTRRARAVGQITADFRVALTGTPVENHLGELWSLFRVLLPGLLGTWSQFRERFAAPIERDQSAERRAALGRVLRPFLLRRTKEAVLPELPPRIELDRLVALTPAERERYETARLAAANAIAEFTPANAANGHFAVLAWLTHLRRLSCHPRLVDAGWTGPSAKLSAFLTLVEELREAGHRALVFSQFTEHLALVREALAARRIVSVYLDGSMSADERRRAVEAFQGGVGDLFLISLKAGGTGLNLTAADHVIHLDPWWNPAVEDQATDRAHRMGQVRPVTVIRLIAQDTIEEAVLALHAEKRELAERLLDGSDKVGRMSAGELVELVSRRAPREDDEEREDEPETPAEPVAPVEPEVPAPPQSAASPADEANQDAELLRIFKDQLADMLNEEDWED